MTAFQKEAEKLEKKELAFLKNAVQKKSSKLEDFLDDKIPEKLYSTLNKAFAKAFELVFDKGTRWIEQTYQKEELEHKYKINAYSMSLKPDKKRLRAFGKGANVTQGGAVAISAVKGVGLGLLGIGLPDIPLFISMVLKGIYEIALNYGYDYERAEERYFILNLVAVSLSHDKEAINGNDLLNAFIENPALPEDYTQQGEIEKVSDVLSAELLCMKFLQGLPLVGVVGGVSDAVFVHRILSYAKLKYEQRFLKQQNR